MFGDKFMGFGGFPGDLRASSDHRLPDFVPGAGGFLPSLDTNPFQCYKTKSNDALDLCKKLSKMGISCDMSIWSEPPEPFQVDPRDSGSKNLHGFDQNQASLSFDGFDQNRASLSFDGFNQNRASPSFDGFDQNRASLSFDGFFNGSSTHRSFLQNSINGVSPAELRFLELQESHNPNGHREMISYNDHRDFLFEDINRPMKRSSTSFENDSFMFEGNRVSQTLAAMEGGPRELRGSSYREDNLFNQSSYRKMTRYFKEDEPLNLAAMEGPRELRSSYGKMYEPISPTSDMPLNLASMISIYGSVDLMAKDQLGCRFLQKLVDQGAFLDEKVIFREILGHVIELSTDPFGNYFIQKLLHVCTDEQKTQIVRVLTSKPIHLIRICLNTYGTRVVQKMIETVKTKQQIELVKSGLKPGFLTLVKDLNGNHVIQTCLHSLGPNENKFVLEAATKYCAEIATHRHGCCVLQCCISSSVGAQHERLVTEIARNSLHLSQDPFGNYVVQYLIDQKVPSLMFLMQFRTHYAELATQKFSSHVVEKCLRVYPESRGDIVRELLSFRNFEHLLHDPFANYVIQTALNLTKGPVHARLVDKVSRCGKLGSSPYCKKIFSKIILKK
ncbi:hypothetical protein AALP_AAs49431U000200 [Arabis alpina]|uniref:PUM-HD domain-containing protein n=1 Tax=Arabis alpina TaxID=50452 RepID=A0A087G1V2_ARAAL|nr:hypothetical protein AALP_AAs49431U000200 [Arabis alpina]